MRRAHAIPIVLAIALALVLLGCIGRLVTAGGEAGLGAEQAAEVEGEVGLVDLPALQAYVGEVGLRLAAAPDVRHGIDYRARVIDLEPPNAFALPGGFIYVSRGLVALLETEDELANVVAHEVAHVSERHHLEHALRRTPFVPVDLATGIGAFAVGLVSPLLGRAVAAVGSAPGGLVLASYSRGQENEADAVGQGIAAASGWDPAAMPRVMQSLAEDERLRGGDPDRRSYFATHPTSPERERATRHRSEAFAIAEPDPVAADREEFLARLAGLPVGRRAREGVVADGELLHPVQGFRLAFPRGWRIADDGDVVRAVAPNEDAIALLAIVEEGDDAAAVARRVLDGSALDLEQGPARVPVGGIEAVRVLGRHRQGGAQFRYVLTWLAHGGLVYQISAGAYAHAFEARSADLDAVGRSFRPLEPGDWPRIREGRLRIARAREGQALADLLPTDSAWSLEQTAVANRLAPDAVLPAGALVKVAPLERYEPGPDAGEPEPDPAS